MGFFRRKPRARVLKNGAQDEVFVHCATDTVTDAAWWGDLYALVHGLSDGDRSTFAAALKASERGDSATLLTVPDTVTNELWTRLTLLGYFDPAPIPDNMQNLPITPAAHVLTAFGADRGRWFMAGAQALMNDLGGEPGRVTRFADAFLRLDKLHQGIRMENLNLLRDMLFRNEQGLQAAGNQAFAAILQRYAKVGAVRQVDEDRWDVTAAGAMIGPFMLDRIVSRRQRPLH
ncbi:hypothetical protein [Actibacterium ureilyticum]|uniref:hypothetical protein n=1 Tax=Actibacterium ureilyticum TaxID=1590614 RepID=UPI000BAAE1BF|nr:hypothetical protein [Actibacterium ureilyticum]